MEKLIENADFFHDDREKSEDYSRKLRDWRDENEEKVTGPQLLSALQTLKKKLTQGKNPKYDTEGWKQARDIYDDLIQSLASDLIDNEKLNAKDVQSAYYDLYIEWFKCGPSTVQLAIMRETFGGSGVDMDEYMKALTGEPRKKLISAMMTPITKNEDTEDTPFYEQHRSDIDRFIPNAFDKPSLLEKDAMKLWLDYSFHLYLDYLHLSNDALYQLLREAGDRFGEVGDGWEDFSDVMAIKGLIGKITKAVKTPGFPKSCEAAQTVNAPIKHLRTKLTKVGDAETYSDAIFDLLEALSTCKGDKKEVLTLFSSVVRFFDNQDSDVIKKRIPFFKVVVPRFNALVVKLPVDFLQESRFCTKIVYPLEYAFSDNKTLVADWLSMLVPLFKRPCYNAMRAVCTVLRCDNQVRWKEHKNVAKEVFQCFTQVQIPIGDEKETKEFVENFTDCVAHFIRGLEKARILKEFGVGMMFLAVNILELKIDERQVYLLAEKLGEHIDINVKENKDKVMEVMKRFHLLLKDDNMPWTDSWNLQRAVKDTIESIIRPVNDGRIFADDDLKMFTSMCYTCLTKDASNANDGSSSSHFRIAMVIMTKLLEWMTSTNRLGYAVRLIPLLLSKYDEDENETVGRDSCGHLNSFATGEPATMTPHLEQLIKIYLDKDDVNVLNPINTTYPFNPAPMKDHFQVMLQQLFDTGEPQVQISMARIFWTASKKQPELFTDKNMKDIVEMAKSNESVQAILLQIMQEVCKRTPERMIKHIDSLMDKNGWNPNLSTWMFDMLSTLALYDKSQANKVINYFVSSIKSNPHDKGPMLTALNSIRLLGFKYPDVIKPRREEIKSLPITDADGLSLKQTTLDMIDGKTPETLRKQMQEQQTALSDLVGKVEEVEEVVVAVRDDLDKQGRKLDNVKNEVSQQGQRLDQVEETVEDTVAKVEEIDSKTLSHAPYWSRDISKLLNPATEHDWRLLSSRLGYSNADIRGWAQQADPCMAMLNEWYATRKTSEATYAILTNLQEMDRMDAALIVENAMKKAEAVVEDEEFEYASPPEIFISYQWGHQEEVKLLHRHLAMAGYDCWMDIGQMGGGDKLFEKIDTGMRAAKLVISCITNKYAKSPNCNREVNLALGVKKPIIPLLLESTPWPPPGSMGPIFSESLYIQFFQTGQEETNDDRFWPVEKFQELLMQLSVNGLVPDEGKIDKVYRNWWMPLEEEIHIDKSKTRNGGKKLEVTQTGDNSESEESPEVFISYQWGKQKNIIKLYQRLTSMGFSCWLDIKQMGGGDSLYDKIDRGVRNSKIVLSCVTSKYAMSANCRREVSLSDALKKPMVPLLLEEMTWPPTGPMSMVMTQLLYIGFQQESAHTDWNGPQFDELINKINKHVGNPSSEQQTSQNKSKPRTADTKSKPPKDGTAVDDKQPSKPTRSSKLPSSSTSALPRKKDTAGSENPSRSPKPTSSNGTPRSRSSFISAPPPTKDTAGSENPSRSPKPTPSNETPPSRSSFISAPPPTKDTADNNKPSSKPTPPNEPPQSPSSNNSAPPQDDPPKSKSCSIL